MSDLDKPITESCVSCGKWTLPEDFVDRINKRQADDQKWRAIAQELAETLVDGMCCQEGCENCASFDKRKTAALAKYESAVSEK